MEERNFPLNRPLAIFMTVLHVGALAALFFPTWHRVMLGFCIWATVSSLGIGVGFHRLHAHRGFKTYKWMGCLLALIGALALQGLAAMWAAIHRIHHQFTELMGLDPHTPLDGRWWAHLDWMLHPDPRLRDAAYLEKQVPYLLKYWFYRQKCLLWLPTVVLAIVCFVFDGLPGVLWGVALPVVVGWHQTFLVNSATHIWGSRRFPTKDNSRNLWWVAIITWGEGWHNNHHHNPENPRHGLAWYELDVNWWLILFLRWLGLAWGLKN